MSHRKGKAPGVAPPRAAEKFGLEFGPVNPHENRLTPRALVGKGGRHASLIKSITRRGNLIELWLVGLDVPIIMTFSDFLDYRKFSARIFCAVEHLPTADAWALLQSWADDPPSRRGPPC
jgi:hypothetical protein